MRKRKENNERMNKEFGCCAATKKEDVIISKYIL